jgi:hypothetical protein
MFPEIITKGIALAFNLTQGLQVSAVLGKKTVTPVVADGSVTTVVVSTTVSALSFPIDAGMIARGEVRPEEAHQLKKFLIQASELAGVRPDYYDTITVSTDVYTLRSVTSDVSESLWTVIGRIQS